MSGTFWHVAPSFPWSGVFTCVVHVALHHVDSPSSEMRGEGGSGRLVTPTHIRTQEMMSPSRRLCAQIKFGGFIPSLSVGWTDVGYWISSISYRWPL